MTYESLQGEHFDSLLQLAFKYEEALETQYIDQESTSDSFNEETLLFQQTFSKYRRLAQDYKTQISRTKRKAQLRKLASRIVQIAACGVILVSISTPFAIAHIETVRIKVMEMLIDIQDEYTRISLIEDEESSFTIPSEWQGAYYPSYLPDGYSSYDLSTFSPIISFINESGKLITYRESTANEEIQIDSEDASISYENINGNMAIVIEKERCSITWTDGDIYFLIMTDEPKSTAIEIAKKVRKISR